ncbi:MAG: YggT family protein [Clostridiaceae bacterium]|nr:YggT family protein [Clostridiaceae bacterium]
MFGYLLTRILSLVELLLLIRVIVSWLPIGYNKFIEILYMLTEPILAPIRRLIESSIGRIMFDFSPIIAFLLIRLVKGLIWSYIRF